MNECPVNSRREISVAAKFSMTDKIHLIIVALFTLKAENVSIAAMTAATHNEKSCPGDGAKEGSGEESREHLNLLANTGPLIAVSSGTV